jgi:transketolase
MQTIDSLSINKIRTLGMDAVQQGNSGHLELRWPLHP